MKESKANKARLIRASVLFSIILVLSGMTLLASAAPLPPNEFRGDVMLNGDPASVGTTINAFINGVPKGSIVVGTAGKYGDGLKYLEVGGDDDSDDGKTINFEIAGVDAQETTTKWRAQEPPRVLDLSAAGAPTGDVIPPTINIVSPLPDRTFATASITVSGSASDTVGVASVEVKLGSGSWETATGTDSWSKSVTLSLGPNTIHARATDTSELSSPEASVTVYYTTGDTPPNISITSPSPDDTFTTASITVSGSASDDEGLDRVEVKVGSGDGVIVDVSGTTASWSETVTLIKGPNTIYATAVDTSGNYTETSVTVVYNPPVGTGDTESPGGSTGGGFAPSSGATPTGTNTQPVSGKTVTPTTPTPTTTGTVAPATTSAKEESGAEPEEKKGLIPGFEAMFAIAGLLAVTYLIRNRV